MKTFRIIMIVVALASAFCLTGCCDRKETPKTTKIDPTQVISKRIMIEGMTCGACEATLEKEGMKIPGVTSVIASTPNKEIIVKFDKSQTDVKTIMSEIRKTGYRPSGEEDYSGATPVKKPNTSKCSGEMKCGEGKCGGAK